MSPLPTMRDYLDIVDPINEWSWPTSKNAKSVKAGPTPAPEATAVAPQSAPTQAAEPAEPAAPAPAEQPAHRSPSREDWDEGMRLISFITRNEYGSGTTMGARAFPGQIRELVRIAHVNKGNVLGKRAKEFLEDNKSKSWMPRYVATWLGSS